MAQHDCNMAQHDCNMVQQCWIQSTHVCGASPGSLLAAKSLEDGCRLPPDHIIRAIGATEEEITGTKWRTHGTSSILHRLRHFLADLPSLMPI